MGKKKPNPGTIQVSSTPTGAKVYLDGSDSGKTTNCTLSNVTAGSHAIKLVKDGYADHSESVAVTGGQTATVDATLVANTIAVTLPTASTVWIKGSQVEIKWQVTATTAGFAQTAISGQMGQSALTEQRLLAQHLGASQPRREAGERLSGGRTSAGSVRTKENTTRSGESREVINSDPAFVQSGIQGSAGATSSSGLPSPQTGPNPLRGRPASQLSSATASLDISKVKIDLYNGSTLITPPIVEETSGSAGTYTWTVRTDLTDGSNYKVRVSCSTDSTVFKNSATFRISGPTQPDLIVDSLMHSPLNPTTADTITIRAVVKNIGSGSAAASTLKIGTETYSIPALAAGASSTMSRTVGPLSAQEWSVTATADLNNVVAELNESNNTLTDSWTVTEPSGADLVVSTLTHSPANPTTADRITVTAVVRNSGGADAVASTLSLSAGGSTTTHSIPVLAAGATSTVTRSVGPLTAGTYTFSATADVNGTVAESNESNNVKTDSFAVTGLPDLIVDSLTHSPLNPTTADTITIRAVVKNIGSGSAVASTLKIGTETYSFPALAAGASSSQNRVVGPLSAQEWSVTATADLNNVVAESNESNNTKTDSWTVTAILPDLEISSLTGTISATGGSFNATVLNSGAASAGASVLKMTLRKGTTVIATQNFAVPTLASGVSHSQAYTITMSVPSGTYTLTAYADTNGVVTESNESNNTKVITKSF
jgi:subtilase family serine protease